MNATDAVDAVLEAPVVPSFTNIGFGVRRGLEHWNPLEDYDLSGRVVLITGATSGLGRAAATQLAVCGAELLLVGRDDERNDAAVAAITEETGNSEISQCAADMGDYDQVRALAKRIRPDLR